MEPILGAEELERLQLGAIFRTLRRQAGLTGEQLGKACNMSQGQVSKIETGRSRLRTEDVDALLRVLNPSVEVRNRIQFHLDTLKMPENSYWRLRGIGLDWKQRQFRELEASARTIRCLQISVIPALLQTSEYAENIILLSGGPLSQADLASTVKERIARQRILSQGGRLFEFLIVERALKSNYGKPACLERQLLYIESLRSRTNIRLGVLRDESQAALPILNDFAIVDDRSVFAETVALGAEHYDQPHVDRYMTYFNTLGRSADWGDRAYEVVTENRLSSTQTPQ